MIGTLMSPDFMQRLAGSLLHFVWQGALIAMITAIGLRLLANRSAEARYALSLSALFLMLAAPLVTFVFYEQTGQATLLLLTYINNGLASTTSITQAATTTAWTQRIVLLWFTGVLVSSIRLIAGWRISRSLTRAGVSDVPSEIQQSFNEIMKRLALTKPVRLLASLRIDTPVAVGWIRPVVLVPIAALAGLDENRLRAVFAHELAHIRRHDFLLNMVQRGVESILFYHPAVWWLSARIRSEREHCCDDMAVQVCGDRSMYAQALIELERVRTVEPELAVSSTGGRLTQRIHRVLGYRIVENDWQSAFAALLFVVVWVTVGAWQSDSTLDARSLAPRPIPAPIMVQSAATAPKLAGAINAIAAIVTAEPVHPEPPTSAQPAQAAPATTAQQTQTGTVEGVLRDDAGRPAAWVRVLAVAVPAVGAPLSSDLLFVSQANTWTDNEGRYRLENLPVGSYYIWTGRIGFPTYYPGTLDPGGSKAVTLAAGATVSSINFAMASWSLGIINPPRPGPGSPLPRPSTGPGTLTLFVSVLVEGGGKIPIFANGRIPRLTLTKVDTNIRYEMGLGSVAIGVPLNLTLTPDEYKVSVEDLPVGYGVKSVMYRADESGLRFVDVSRETLKISQRAINSGGDRPRAGEGAPDLPIVVTLTESTKALSTTLVTGTSEDMIVMPKIPPVGVGFSPASGSIPSDAGIYISGKPGVLFSDGTFYFSGVSAGLHRLVLYTMPADGPRVAAADVLIVPNARQIDGVALQVVPVIPKNVFSPPLVSARVPGPAVLVLPSLSIRVLDEVTQQPIASGYVVLSGVTGSIRRYVGTSTPLAREPTMLPGEYTLTATSNGYITKTQTITVGYGEPSVDIKITRSPK